MKMSFGDYFTNITSMLIWSVNILVFVFNFRRVYLSVAAASIYMASQASDIKKTQKG